jgi:branched-chain amino acid transport system substrate-binding protein
MRTFGKALVAAVMTCLVAVAEAQPPIRVGATLSQTGSLAVMGQNQLRGYQLCVKHTNEKGGVLGRRIELLVEDDQSEGATAAALYEKLIIQDKVDAIFGPTPHRSPRPWPMWPRSAGCR